MAEIKKDLALDNFSVIIKNNGITSTASTTTRNGEKIVVTAKDNCTAFEKIVKYVFNETK